MNPLISIILPTYNGSQYIWEAIDSVLSQDYKNFELLIIDDASIDQTSEIIADYQKKDRRIRVFRNEKNMKLVNSLNRWIWEAKGEYIARMDDDDIWKDPSKLTKQLDFFRKNPHLWVVGTFGMIIDDEGKETGGKIVHAHDSPEVRRGFWLKNQLIHTSILAKKSAILAGKWYNEKWLYVEDYDLWLKILSAGFEIWNIPDFCISYRVRTGSTTWKKYYKMQWLTFLRLWQEKNIYPNMLRKCYCLSIRFLLVLVPVSVIQKIKQFFV